MTGAPSQVDTFDYKPELQNRDSQKLGGTDPKTGFFTTNRNCLASPIKWSQHGQSGSWVSVVFPTVAKHTDDMAFIQSCPSVANYRVSVSMELAAEMARPVYPTMGAWLSNGLGSMKANLPSWSYMMRSHAMLASGPLDFAEDSSTPVARCSPKKDIRDVAPLPGMSDARQQAQLELLRESNLAHQQTRGDHPDLSARIRLFELAYRMQAAAPAALDLSKKTEATKKLYGMDNKDCASFGCQCMLTRRLVKSGVRFVQIFSPTNRISGEEVAEVPWDGHNDILVNHRYCSMMTDIPFAGLLTNLKERRMLKDTLVIWGGEFGRTSDSQGSKGRDYNPQAYTTIFCGGGVKGGVHTARVTNSATRRSNAR